MKPKRVTHYYGGKLKLKTACGREARYVCVISEDVAKVDCLLCLRHLESWEPPST